MPKRIQRKREKGWHMPDNSVYVGRPTKWGNPFLILERFSQVQAVEAYCDYILTAIAWKPEKYNLDELRGKDLACWCPVDQPCHADTLLELVNGEAVNRMGRRIMTKIKTKDFS